MTGRRIVALLILGASITLTTSPLAAQGRVAIAGTVSDTAGNALDGVKVTLWRQGRAYEDTTKNKGRYDIPLDAGRPIDCIQYTFSGFDPGAVEQLSGQSNQTIAKVLYRIKEPRSLDEVDALVRAFEVALRTTATAAPDARPKALAELRAPDWRMRLEGLTVPVAQTPEQQPIVNALQQRIDAVKIRYSQLQ
jgi:hypothetical protein